MDSAPDELCVKLKHLDNDQWLVQTNRRHQDRLLLQALRNEFADAQFGDAGYNIMLQAPNMTEDIVHHVAEELINDFYEDRQQFCAKRVLGLVRDCAVVVRANRPLPFSERGALVATFMEVPGVSAIDIANNHLGSEVCVYVANDFFDPDDVAVGIIERLTAYAQPSTD
ncbi:MAG TPA: hypothetical protein VK694_00290 [Verrucomicrobiae bacterium]|nr:hypothetical protein [Verrucomicrobiae bacterium]